MGKGNKKNRMATDLTIPSRSRVWQMFDRIADRYDPLNRLLSFGQDIRWRKKLVQLIPSGNVLQVLDIATGTGDQALSIVQTRQDVAQVTGIDLAKMMLKKGMEKTEKLGLTDRIRLQEGDACDLDFNDASFDVVTISFGIRNVENLEAALNQMYRVLRINGVVLILEFSLPGNPLIRSFYLLYFRYILPFLGSIISGDKSAYRYLNETVETFPFGDDFCNFLRRSGFHEVTSMPLTFGVVTIYRGIKQEIQD
jgi:demethylmenaquinone methyltransferase/2-methoxy-6-polyprenyl-1,4-benzoquinol methylase